MYRVMAVIPPFNGNILIEVFLDWPFGVELFFNLIEIMSYKMVKLTAYKLKRGRAVWWDQM